MRFCVVIKHLFARYLSFQFSVSRYIYLSTFCFPLSTLVSQNFGLISSISIYYNPILVAVVVFQQQSCSWRINPNGLKQNFISQEEERDIYSSMYLVTSC